MTEIDNPAPTPADPSTPPRLARRFEQLPPANRNLILYGVIALLVIAGLLLPPISLFDRLFRPCGELAIGGDSSVAQIPDGLSVLQASADQSYRVTLSAVTQADFESGTVESLMAARDALPVNLMLKSPVYQIAVCGEKAQPGSVRVNIPAGAQPVDTLDLYAFDAESSTWVWIGSSKNTAQDTILAAVDTLPKVVALMQTTSAAPAIGAETDPGETLNADVADSVTEVYPTGWVIASDGSLGGDRAGLPASSTSPATYPVIRNYLTRGQPNPDLVRGVLQAPETRAAHIDALIALAADYAGVTLDYQGLAASDREAYAAFVVDLAEALHAQGKRLHVVLPQPSFTADGQADTGGYDWTRIGMAADAVQAPMSTPVLIEWATSQVNRYKFQPILSVASVQTANGVSTPIAFKQAVEQLGKVTASQPLSVTSDSIVTFTLQSNVAIDDFAFDKNAQAYTYAYTDKAGATYQVRINTAAGLASDLANVLPRYVRGVVVRGAAGNAAPSVADALTVYRQQSTAKISGEIKIVWSITAADGKTSKTERPLTESWLNWRAPLITGTYSVAASIAGVDAGSLKMVVNPAAPAVEVETTVAGAGVGGGGANGAGGTSGGVAAGGCYDATYAADVTVPDGTHFDNNKDFTKTWKVRNTGSCAWSADTELVFVSGSQLGAPSTAKVGALDAGTEIEIDVPMKTTDADGNFTGVWQLRNKDGFFGQTLTVVIQAGEAVAAAPQAGPVAPIGNIGGFEVGGHVAGFGNLGLMASAGMKWVKIQAHAGVDLSGTINDAHASGFKILIGLLGDKSRVLEPAYQGEYAAGAAALAAAGADAIEVWNEANLDREWPFGQISGASYAALLARTYPAIKAANPGTLVISGAPAPTGAESLFPGAVMNDDKFLAQMAAAGAANYMDCIGAHYNEGIVSPNQTSGDPRVPSDYYTRYFQGMLNTYYNAFGGSRKVCFTELGYLTGEGYPDLASTAPSFAWASNVTVAQQAQWLAEAASLAARSGKVRLMIIWNIDFTNYGSDPMAGYAIIRPGGSCPACDSLRAVLGLVKK